MKRGKWATALFMSVKLTTLLVGLGVFAATTAEAAIVGSVVGPVKHYYSYTDYGTGDVVIVVTNPPATCPGGFWVRMSDPGAKNVVAELLAAVASQIPMQIWGYDDLANIWPGSGTATCRLYVVDYVL